MQTQNTSPHHTSTADSETGESSNLPGQRRYQSSAFFGDAQEIEIEHNGAIYRLRKTSLGKLILTK